MYQVVVVVIEDNSASLEELAAHVESWSTVNNPVELEEAHEILHQIEANY